MVSDIHCDMLNRVYSDQNGIYSEYMSVCVRACVHVCVCVCLCDRRYIASLDRNMDLGLFKKKCNTCE